MLPGSGFDRRYLDELLDGDAEYAGELFETYFQSADSAYIDAENRLSQGDSENAFRPFHTLKGASGSVGLSKLQEFARTLELKAKSGELVYCREQMPALRLAIDEAKDLLRDYLKAIS